MEDNFYLLYTAIIAYGTVFIWWMVSTFLFMKDIVEQLKKISDTLSRKLIDQ